MFNNFEQDGGRVALDLNHLEVLVAVADCGSIAKAAGRLNKVRSAVSYDVRCLEEQLGVQLLDRSGYRAKLTDAGNMVIREGTQILSQARALEHRTSLIGEEWEPSVKVVLEGAIPMPPIIRAIKAFSGQDVPTQIVLQTDYLSGVVKRFEHEEADLMLVKDFEAPRDEYVVHQLPDLHFLLVAARGHRVFQSASEKVTLAELRSHLELSIEISGQSGAGMPETRFGAPRMLNLSGFYEKKEALLMGLGFGWMPNALIAKELADKALKVIPFEEGDTFQFTPSLMYRKDRPLGKAGTLFRDVLLQEFIDLT
jgi:DNA-binding transcriptional LysR family regulator